MLDIFYESIIHLGHLYKSNLPKKAKFILFWHLLRINFKYLFLDWLFKFKKEHFLGFTMKTYKYERICGMFKETFIGNQYNVECSKSKPIIIDCGANIGIAVLYYKWRFPDSTIYAYEASPETYKLLEENVEINNLKDVHVFNKAIFNRNGKITFYQDNENPGSGINSINEQRMNKKQINIDCIDLSEVIEKVNPDIIKMDIEGAERDTVQRVVEKEGFRNVSYFILEYHHKIGSQKSELASFLSLLEKSTFEYQINSRCLPYGCKEKHQDVIISCYKR